MIYGFVAPKEHGKTTACNIIKKHLDDVVQTNFKDALVQELKDNFPDLLKVIAEKYFFYDVVQIEDYPPFKEYDFYRLFEEKPPLLRTLMQNYGTNVRRVDDPDYWVKQWRKTMYSVGHFHTLTDDVRFLNEAKSLRQMGGILIRLERTDLEQTDTHQSETEQKEIECDYTITCGAGELDKLEEELVKIIT